MEAKIANERGKRHERTEGYLNDEDALRREFGSDLEPEESEAARGLAGTGRGHGRGQPRRMRELNGEVLVDATLLREHEETSSQVAETDPED